MLITSEEQPKAIDHKHEDARGHIFGHAHPIKAEHSNPKTKKFHNITVEREGLTDPIVLQKHGFKKASIQE